ncbi:MAG: hypothetical protein L0Z50_37750 [Verrucomicrobiales bacterium]|nr:hypothetical protein [Verrucomicrobiales bacterium]
MKTNSTRPSMISALVLARMLDASRRRMASGAVLALLMALVHGVPHVGASSTPPDRMTYQGFLVDANGDPLAASAPANYPVVFRIYDAPQSETPLWTEQQIVTVDKGNFSVLLGEGTVFESESRPALSSVFAGETASDRYIGITATIDNTQMEIAPRLRLMSSPYAFLATSAANVVQPDGTSVLSYSGDRVHIAGGATLDGPSASLYIPTPHEVTATNGGINIGDNLFLDGDEIRTSSPLYVNRASSANLVLNQGGGRVGIGTANPTEALHVNGNIRIADDADLFGLDQIIGFNDLRIYGDATGGPDVYVAPNGLVGIGTTIPEERLHVNGNFTPEARAGVTPFLA